MQRSYVYEEPQATRQHIGLDLSLPAALPETKIPGAGPVCVRPHAATYMPQIALAQDDRWLCHYDCLRTCWRQGGCICLPQRPEAIGQKQAVDCAHAASDMSLTHIGTDR